MTHVNLPAFYLGIQEELEKHSRCWEGYEPVPGKKPYSEDSCRPVGEKKHEKEKKAEETPEQLLARVRSGKANFNQFLENAKAHNFKIPGYPNTGNALVKTYIATHTPEQVKQKILKQDDSFLKQVIEQNKNAFKGVQNSLPPAATKVAIDLNTMPINENILPTISSQAKWKFVRTKDGLKLTDGNLVYSFGGLPEEFPAEDTRLSRLSDDNILDFDKDAISKGTAQIHRSSPDNIYMTLATGADNPTFMLQHEEGQNWRYSPSKKFVAKLKAMQEKAQQENPASPENISVDPHSLIAGAEEHMKQALYNPYLGVGHGLTSQEIADYITKGLDKAKEYGDTAVSTIADNPLASMGVGYALAKSLRNLTNSGDETQRDLKNQEWQAIAAGTLPTLASLAIKAP